MMRTSAYLSFPVAFPRSGLFVLFSPLLSATLETLLPASPTLASILSTSSKAADLSVAFQSNSFSSHVTQHSVALHETGRTLPDSCEIAPCHPGATPGVKMGHNQSGIPKEEVGFSAKNKAFHFPRNLLSSLHSYSSNGLYLFISN